MFRLKVRLHGQDVTEIALESGREYTFGRGTDSDVQLEEQPGISRSHFKIREDDGAWTAEVLSKFGDITHAGRPVKSLKLEIGSVFKVAGYDFLFADREATVTPIEQDQSEAEYAMASGGEVSVRSSANLPALTPGTPYEGSDEATRVMEIAQTGDVYIRIVEASGREETTRLEGRKWIAGREDSSQILLNDRKASRRQFELVASLQGNFVRDLGSSNGTQLNGIPLVADELKPLRSGDVIQVGQLAIHFEVRDPHFERRLQVVPPSVMAAQMPAVQNAPPVSYEMINYPVANGPGGAVRLDAGGVPSIYQAAGSNGFDDAKAKRTKKIRFILIAAVVLLPVLYMLSNDTKPKPSKVVKQLPAGTEAFNRLTPQKQQQVKEAYILGRNLFMQGKQALAAEQFRKIHEIIKEGYEDSLALASECQAQAEQEANRRIVEREMQEAAQNRVVVLENLKKCEPIANSTFNESELRTCLAPTYERDPGNLTISDYMSRVSLRVSARAQKAASAKEYASRVARGRALYAKAVAVEKSGDPDGAVEAYSTHLAANLPDPDGLRAVSLKKVGSLKASKAASIAAFQAIAETAFVNHDYKTAINNINRIKSLDPYNTLAAELNGRIQREKDSELRKIYEDSVINEGLGQIEQAKVNWKKILDMDHPDGVYYKRARNKMRAFGGGS